MALPNYGETKKLVTPLDTSPPIPGEKNHRVQQSFGIFLYYARTLVCNMLPALNKLAEQHSNPTKNNEAAITQFLDYIGTNPPAIIKYKSIDMIIHIDSDASYSSEPRAHICTGGHYYLISLPTDPEKSTNLPPPENCLIHMECIILKHVVASTEEVEVRGLFNNGKTSLPLHITLQELGFPQPPTLIKTYNYTTKGIITATVRQKDPRQCTCDFIG